MDEIDELWNNIKDTLSYEDLQAIENNGRRKHFVGPPVEIEGIQTEPIQVVAGRSKVNPIEYPDNYRQQMPTSAIVKDNYNRSIDQRTQYQNEVADMFSEAEERQRKYGVGIDDSINRLRQTGSKRYSNPQLDTDIEKAAVDYEGVEIPQSDLYSQLILSIAPALFGAFGGEDAALSAPKASDRARAIYNENRKSDVDAIKNKKDKLQKRYEQLTKLKEAGSKAFNEQRDLELKQITAELDANKTAFQMGQTEKLKQQDAFNEIGKESAQAAQRGSDKIMDNENLPMIEAGKNKRDATGGRGSQQRITADERKAASTLAQIRKANRDLEALGGETGKDYPSMSTNMFGVLGGIASGRMNASEYIEQYIKDPAVRAQLQAEIDWVNAKLRRESGAAISIGEFKSEANRYFPRMGDDAKVLAQKASSRRQVENGLKQEAGGAQEVPIATTVVEPPKTEKTSRIQELLKKAKK